MRAIDVNPHLLNFCALGVNRQNEFAATVLATDLFVDEFAVDAQFTAAMRALHVVASQRQLGNGFDLLKWHEFGNLDAIWLEIGIQERAAIAAMDELFGHFIAARRTWSAGPRRHRRLPVAMGIERL